MNFGVAMFPTDYSVAPDVLARMVEDRGFESLFFPEHTHIPSERRTPYPAGGDLPKEYWHTYDPFVALTVAASVTNQLRVGTGICLVIERDPIITAKEVASLDRLSGGRLLFGVGAGWNVEEMANHGTDAARRFGVLRERVQAMRAIWTEEQASFHGEHVRFDAIWSWPKPLQTPHPPVLVGGNGARVLDRVLDYGDEWMPNAVGGEEHLAARMAELRERAEAAGRPAPGVTLYAGPAQAAAAERYAQAGVGRYLFYVPSREQERVEQRLDQLAAIVAEFRGG